MNWRLKNLAFHALQRIPLGKLAYQTSQRIVARRFLPNISARTLKTYRIPLEAFAAVPGAKMAMEFGAGRGLMAPLLLGHSGAEKVYFYDLPRLAHIPHINASILQLSRHIPGDWPSLRTFDDLKVNYGIEYRALGDARSTELADSSVDVVYSIATLEHFLPEQILPECKRILRPQGRICFTIDYHDHYASSYSPIGYLNFYQFSEAGWHRYIPSMHYQNRLRNSDYLRLFVDAGLVIHEQKPLFKRWAETDLRRVALDNKSARYSREDLTASNGGFLLGLE